MVGTSPDVRGGISTVVRGYQDAGLFERFPMRYITTHRDGSVLVKARAAVAGYLTLCRLLVTAPAPLLHVHLASHASFWRKTIVCALATLRRRPYVLHLHGGGFSKFYDFECGVLSKWFVRQVLRHAAVVLALSEQWRRELSRIAPGVRVRCLPNAVSIPASAVDTSGHRELRILFAGRIAHAKGTFDLLNAFARLSSQFPNAVLVCPGDGEPDRLLARARELGLEGRVQCPGWLDRAAMANEMRKATVFALPSHAEGVPMALLEAMALGLPVITTPVGGIPEVISAGENGLLVQPRDIDGIANALGTLLSSPSERARLGAAARDTITTRFALDGIIDRLACLYTGFGLTDRGR